jgi:hypothetical protein
MTTTNQRWREGRSSSRPAGEPIRTDEYEVASIESDRVAKSFVLFHHYSATYPAARERFGLYRHGELVGVAVFSQPSNNATLAIFPGTPRESYELGRFVLLDEVPGNGETWFLARCFEQLRARGAVGVVSFSDPFPRATAAGRRVFPGHVGTIYQASNAVYLGRARAEKLLLLPDATTLHRRTLAKIVSGEKGSHYAVEKLVAQGADPLGAQDPREWLAYWLPRLTRSLHHPGNHKYAWTLQRRHRRALGASQPYPKLHQEAA